MKYLIILFFVFDLQYAFSRSLVFIPKIGIENGDISNNDLTSKTAGYGLGLILPTKFFVFFEGEHSFSGDVETTSRKLDWKSNKFSASFGRPLIFGNLIFGTWVGYIFNADAEFESGSSITELDGGTGYKLALSTPFIGPTRLLFEYNNVEYDSPSVNQLDLNNDNLEEKVFGVKLQITLPVL